MIVVIQRVSEASVTIEGSVKSQITEGLLVLVGISEKDAQKNAQQNQEDLEWLSRKIVNLRIFSDSEGKMNLSVIEKNGDILLISQFTLLASTKKGNRPSYIDAARPENAIPIYEKLILQLQKDLTKNIQTGTFGADMQVSLLNDGPVTIVIDTENKV